VTVADAVVPVAGLGTRLLPATKSQPKEMLPVGGKPVVQHVVEELAGAGAQRVLFVTGRGKHSIEDHFDADAELVRLLRESGREELLAKLEYERMGVEFLYTRQDGQRGLADAVACAERFVHGDPFAVALGDCIIGCPGRPGGSDIVAALSEALRSRRAACAVAVQPVLPDDVQRYGIVAPAADPQAATFPIAALVEKPAAGEAPSDLAVAARYVFAPAIFDAIRGTAPDAAGEVQLTDAIQALIDSGLPVVGVRLAAGERRYDAGTVETYSRTFVDFALTDPCFGARLRGHVRELLDETGSS
jgi:UTP--glucose-1-phosphate uridylyltransferase